MAVLQFLCSLWEDSRLLLLLYLIYMLFGGHVPNSGLITPVSASVPVSLFLPQPPIFEPTFPETHCFPKGASPVHDSASTLDHRACLLPLNTLTNRLAP